VVDRQRAISAYKLERFCAFSGPGKSDFAAFAGYLDNSGRCVVIKWSLKPKTKKIALRGVAGKSNSRI
ncbi:hypothetical protein, partial [Escherichia coli]|uniref:hypothetical protein n=1 Tax=Escherichia coli TaxID=562 RepID=UPI001954BD78